METNIIKRKIVFKHFKIVMPNQLDIDTVYILISFMLFRRISLVFSVGELDNMQMN